MARDRFNPVRDLFTLQDRMNRLFEEAADRRTRSGEDEAEVELERVDWVPAADVFESEREYMLVIDLPGIDRDGLEVSLDEGRLSIRGERAAPPENLVARRTERPGGRFVRSFTLPQGVDRQRVVADYKDGVLRLSLPKMIEPKPRKVKIDVK